MKQFHLNAENRKVLYRALLVLAVFFGIVLLETCFLPFLHGWGTADLVLCQVLSFSLVGGLVPGGYAGLCGGVMLSFLGGSPMDILFYTVIGFGFGYFGGGYVHRKFPSYAVCLGVGSVAKVMWAMLCIRLGSSEPSLGAALGATILPDFLMTLLWGVILYVPMGLLPKRLYRGEKGGMA